jgi:L-threonylcarbamoyladenylate synthase
VETAAQFETAVEEAVALLKKGQVVALPTETVYGLAANALNVEAVERIYEVKGRPTHNPLIVHVASLAMARDCVADWSPDAGNLARKFWPGPLTIVLRRSEKIPNVVTAGGSTVGVRWPLHPLMRRVIEQCEFPLAAPSANLSNQVSPTNSEHVLHGLGGRIPLIVDAGPTSFGIESTVVDLSSDVPRVLRPGMISAKQISEVVGREVGLAASDSSDLRSPGLLKKHYSPRAKLIVATWRNSKELARLAEKSSVAVGAVHVLAYGQIPQANPYARVAIIPEDAEAYARALYAELHRSDELGAKLIIVELPPHGPEWEGIHDRLRRASAES